MLNAPLVKPPVAIAVPNLPRGPIAVLATAPPIPPAIPLSPWAVVPKSKLLNLSFVPWEKNGWLSKRPRLTKATVYIFLKLL